MASTYGDLITDAFIEIRVLRPGETLRAELMAFGVERLNQLLDSWNADKLRVWVTSFTDSFTLTPSLSPHTIGPGGTFSVTQRPVSIDQIQLNLGGSPAVYVPINVRDEEWYQQQAVPALSTPIPTDCAYVPEWPLGKLYFWPVPSTAYGLRLWTRHVLADVAATDPVSLPPGYELALKLSLAEDLAEPMGQSVGPHLQRRASRVRGMIFGVNTPTGNIRTADHGLGHSGGHSYFNWRSRTTSGA